MQENKEDLTPKVDAEANPQGTEKVADPVAPAGDAIDYKLKFSESSKEALRLLEETKAKDAEIARLKALAESGATYSNNSDQIYPGFDTLGEEEQKNLIAYTNSIKQKTLEEVYKDPAIAFAKQSFNERKWGEAFEKISSEYPELRDSREDFKTKYYNPANVPSNIGDILKDLAKVYLFDKAKDIGAQEAAERASRIEVERAKGGEKTTRAGRSLEDWQQMAAQNPARFAKMAKEFNDDMSSGKLK